MSTDQFSLYLIVKSSCHDHIKYKRQYLPKREDHTLCQERNQMCNKKVGRNLRVHSGQGTLKLDVKRTHDVASEPSSTQE